MLRIGRCVLLRQFRSRAMGRNRRNRSPLPSDRSLRYELPTNSRSKLAGMPWNSRYPLTRASRSIQSRVKCRWGGRLAPEGGSYAQICYAAFRGPALLVCLLTPTCLFGQAFTRSIPGFTNYSAVPSVEGVQEFRIQTQAARRPC
jgi:hypothetical protein